MGPVSKPGGGTTIGNKNKKHGDVFKEIIIQVELVTALFEMLFSQVMTVHGNKNALN